MHTSYHWCYVRLVAVRTYISGHSAPTGTIMRARNTKPEGVVSGCAQTVRRLAGVDGFGRGSIEGLLSGLNY